MRLGHIVFALFASLIACGIALPVSRRITRPVREIADDVDRIAGGDLDHQIRISTGTEFTRLEEGISTMVDSLKENIRHLHVSEEMALSLIHICSLSQLNHPRQQAFWYVSFTN